MNRVPPEAEMRSSALEDLLDRIRDGLAAEEELMGHYAELYAGRDSIALGLLKTLYGKDAERVGVDPLSLVGVLLAERLGEIRQRQEVYSSRKNFEAWVERGIRREIWKLRKRNQRAPAAGGPLVDEAAAKGYQPGSQGDPLSSILFQTWNERLESAMNKVPPMESHQRMLYQVLARLYVLKGWDYQKLARLVYGPGQDEDDIRRQGERIRKWIQQPIRHIRAARKRGRPPRAGNAPVHPHPPDERIENDRDSNGAEHP